MFRPAPTAILRRGFTLVELMVSMAILCLILVVVMSITQAMGDVWKSSRSKVESFQASRQAFEMITRSLSQATLNTYYDYFDSAGRAPRDAGYTVADHYGRQSELHFVTGKALVNGQVTHAVFFQTPRGFANDTQYQDMSSLLNACGFYILHGQDTLRPAFLAGLPNAPANDTRYRLMQFLQPSEQLSVYSGTGPSWFQTPLGGNAAPVEQVASNVISLVVLPRKSSGDAAQSGSPLISTDYEYDSRATGGSGSVQSQTQNQLPPLVEVILVAIDENSARRMEAQNLQLPSGLFSQDTQKADEDLAKLEDFLNQNRLVYRVFRTTVPLRNSKWSS